MSKPAGDRVTIYVDGSCRPNPGLMTVGIVAESNTFNVAITSVMGEGTNNTAEYIAVELGIRTAIGAGLTRVTIKTDSKLVRNQLAGRSRVTHEHLREKRDTIRKLLTNRDYKVRWIPRAQNVADAYSRMAEA